MNGVIITGVPEIMEHLYFMNISLSFDREHIMLELKDILLNSLQGLYQTFFCTKLSKKENKNTQHV
jgi:hypothetical protein